MVLYSIEATAANYEELTDKTEKFASANVLQTKTDQAFLKTGRRSYIFISRIHRQKITCGAAVWDPGRFERDLAAFWAATGIKAVQVSVSEITLRMAESMLRCADRGDYINDCDDILEQYGIYALLRDRFFKMEESVIQECPGQSALRRMAHEILCDESMAAELDRIFAPAGYANVKGHPVHYIVKTDDAGVRDKMLDILLPALYQNNRLVNRRYTTLRFRSLEDVSPEKLSQLYASSDGGTIVIDCQEGDADDTDESDFAQEGTDTLITLCEHMKKHKNRVLTIFCLPRASGRKERLILEHIGSVTVVNLHEDLVCGERAKQYLKKLAQKHGVRGTKALYTAIADRDKGFLPSDLNRVFDSWFDRRLKTDFFPQYAGIVSACAAMAKKKAAGSAYSKLNEMIGLQSAKAVINQALDYYKAQKLFADKGMKANRPTMHMVFTGNPGTAKTTAARLFARIMKENGLLSVGNLYEVGRADLVGRYVGWTAKNVQEKFSQAKGSVLFIDEAYSLLDDRSGSYGDEAINTIVQEMENCREDIVVIFAGYPDEMDDFLARNPGLCSRIAFHVPFADYDAEELYAIGELIAKKKGLRFAPSVRDKLLPVLAAARNIPSFGNGRYVRSLVEKAMMKQAGRLVNADVDQVTAEDISMLTAEDFDVPGQTAKRAQKRIGFAAP